MKFLTLEQNRNIVPADRWTFLMNLPLPQLNSRSGDDQHAANPDSRLREFQTQDSLTKPQEFNRALRAAIS